MLRRTALFLFVVSAIHAPASPPLPVELTKLIASDGTNNNYMGNSAAVQGQTAIIGAYGDNSGQGSAYIFMRNENGADDWGEVVKLTAFDGSTSDSFGWAVAIDGHTAVVGAPADDTGTAVNQGGAYIFERNTGGSNNWGIVKKLAASDGTTNDLLGGDVAISGDTIVLGAQGADIGANNEQGAAYVFERNCGGSNNWGQVAKIAATNGAAGDEFGLDVDIDKDHIIVGTWLYNDGPGAAYIFERNTGGIDNWGQVAGLTASDGATGDNFGASVTINGDFAAVGAPDTDIGGNTNQGSVYIFARNVGGANAWGEVKKITAEDGRPFDSFGERFSLSMDRSKILAGSPDAEIGLNSGQGAAYLFERNHGGMDNWGQVCEISSTDGATGNNFGKAVAMEGDTAIAGAWRTTIGSNANQGAAYVFHLQNNKWINKTRAVASDGTAGEYFGIWADIDGDTFVSGVRNDNIGTNIQQGSVYIFERNLGGAENWGQAGKLISTNYEPYMNMGRSVAISRDTVIAGAYFANIGANVQQGAAFIFERNFGGSNNWGQVKKLIASDGAPSANAGRGVAIDGDTVVMSGHRQDAETGAAYIFERNTGGSNNWGQVKKLTASDGVSGDNLGWGVGINSDTVVAGAYGADIGAYPDAGAAYVFKRNAGGSNNWGQVKKLESSTPQSYAHFGSMAAIDNDIIVVGASYEDVGANANQGAAYVFERNRGGANNWGQVARLTASDGTANALFGNNVSISGSRIAVASKSASGNVLAYLYERNLGGIDNWGQAARLDSGDLGSGDYFTAAVDNNRVLIGAAAATVGANANQGSAVLFESDYASPALDTPMNCVDASADGIITNDNMDAYGRTLNVRPKLIWQVPSDVSTNNQHFKVYYDTTDASTLIADSSSSTTGFEYDNGAGWTAFPGGGAAGTNVNEQARYKPQSDLTEGTSYYWRVVSSDTNVLGSSVTNRFIIWDRTWTDSIEAGVTRIRKPHVDELRDEANYTSASRGLVATNWTDSAITPNVTLIRSVHMTELRGAVSGVTNITGETVNWTDPVITPNETLIRTNHIMELRSALQDI